MKICSRWEVDGDSIGKLLDLSFVEGEHIFGLTEDGTEVHLPGSIQGMTPGPGHGE